jgi:membrane dipeptidase
MLARYVQKGDSIDYRPTTAVAAGSVIVIADLVGVEHVACGFDLGAYYSADEHHDLVSPDQAQNFIRGLEKEGFSEDEIKDIAYRNVFRFLRQYM